MLRQFAQKIEELRRLIDDSRSASFLLAVSGGMDSMCMLDLFSNILDTSEYAVAHCNFSLRGEESDGDQTLVEACAAELGVRLFIKRFDTVAYAQEHGISIEMAARELRYAWFDELCRENGFNVISVAHNANDNAETLILNLLRGTGLNGLHCMDSFSSSVIARRTEGQAWHSHVFRPLLEFTRKQIEGYVLTHRIPYRHDSSNFESDYKRNKIRNEVFPVFAQINPSFVRTLNREIGYFAEAGSIVDEWCRAQLPNVLISAPDQRRTADVLISTVKLLSIQHWRYLLYYILSPYGFNHQSLASVESLLTSSRTQSGKRFESDTHMLYIERGTLVIKEKINDFPVPDSDIMVVRGAGVYNFNGSRFSVEVLDRTADMPLRQPDGILIFDADILQFPFVCRRWRQGDWLIPLGMRGRKKVSDLFTDLKFSILQKNAAIILVDTRAPGMAEQQHIAALLGHRIDGSYKVTSSTRKILRITIC